MHAGFLSPSLRLRLLEGVLLLASIPILVGCETVPAPGERVVMVIKQVPDRMQALQASPGLSLALRRGVTRGDVLAGRLVMAACQRRGPPGTWSHPHFGHVLLPVGVVLARGSPIVVAAEEADVGADAGADVGPFTQFYGHYQQGFVADEGEALACQPEPVPGGLHVAVIGVVPYWDFDAAHAEALRLRDVGDAELAAGRIALGECATGPDSWARWVVRLPEGLRVQPGQHIEALAGARSASTEVGPLSLGLRKVAEPPPSAFILTQGRLTVGCGAPAKPAP